MLYVVNYHYIRKNYHPEKKGIIGIKPEHFIQQLKTLSQIGYIIRPRELTSNIIASDKKYILITFDDGLREQYENALPILDSLKYEAMFFVNTSGIKFGIVQNVHKIHLIRDSITDVELLNYIKSRLYIELNDSEKKQALSFYRFDDINAATVKYILNIKLASEDSQTVTNELFNKLYDEKTIYEKLYMNESQVKYLGQKGMIGSHSHRHLPLGNLDEIELKNELDLSKRLLENLTGSEINYISYPYGSYDAVSELVFNTAKSSGYKFGFTTKPEINNKGNDLLQLSRFDCNDAPGGKNYNKVTWK